MNDKSKEANLREIQDITGYFKYLIKKDVEHFLASKTIKRFRTTLAPMYNNPNVELNHCKIACVDIEMVYWHKAFQLEIISELTYLNGLVLSKAYEHLPYNIFNSLAADKRYFNISSGAPKEKIVKGNSQFKKILGLIRYECLKDMRRLSKLLKNEYIRYKIDSIYFVDSKLNNEIVKDFMKNDLIYQGSVFNF
jgi:hypothetical protein